MTSGPNGWWRHYFDEHFLRLYRPHLPATRTRREVAGVVELLGLRADQRVLDLACGWGRHAVPLARFGCRVVGVDLSVPLLRAAARRAERAGVAVGWVRADARALPLRPGFDAAISMFSSLGYFLSDEEDLRVLRGVRAVLRPDGRFLLETMHRDMVVRQFAERDWWTGERGEHVWVEREFDAVEGVSHEWLRWRTSDGQDGEKYHAIRVRTATEWDHLLRAAGLEPDGWFGGWSGREFDHRAERMIVVARRGGGR
jgi:cyclopropane fatty-acyl-phospholipid synthase-like methyltransferase